MSWPSGFQDGLEASPSPFVSRSTPVPSKFILKICWGPVRPETKTISLPVFGFTLGSTSMAREEEIRFKLLPSKFAT